MIHSNRINNKDDNEMYEILLKDYGEAKKNGWTLAREALSEVINKIKSRDDESVFNVLERLIEEKAKHFGKLVNRNHYSNSKAELLIYSQQVYNQYISKYKLGHYRKILYVVGEEGSVKDNGYKIFYY